jgi:hypothetical protein
VTLYAPLPSQILRPPKRFVGFSFIYFLPALEFCSHEWYLIRNKKRDFESACLVKIMYSNSVTPFGRIILEKAMP